MPAVLTSSLALGRYFGSESVGGGSAAMGEIIGIDLGTTKDRKSTRLNSSHALTSRMPSSA